MRIPLAEKLLVELMDWNSTEIAKERPLIQALSTFKYDEYQQYSLGTRFIESLVKWLHQFGTRDDKRTAYDFLKNHLIFISNTQMLHLVASTFSERINPVLISYTAKKLQLEEYKLSRIIGSEEYTKSRRSSLYIGLSDGARMDQLRRSCRLNNEQVVLTYSIDKSKVEDMLAKLKEDGAGKAFSSVFLIDDFTASGASYFRYDEDKQKWKGKILKTVRSLITENEALYPLVSHNEPLTIQMIFYIATQDALDNLNKTIAIWKTEECSDKNVEINLSALQVIGAETKNRVLEDTAFLELAEKKYDNSVEDSHYHVGKHDKPYLGFNECALPVVLIHNTPNNSLPILWDPGDGKFTGLFPRTKRHRDQE